MINEEALSADENINIENADNSVAASTEVISEVKKKKKAPLIVLLVILLILDIAALVIYIIGIDKVLSFIK